MEDSSRDLEKELKKYSVPNPFKRSGKWQMLFVSEDGKVVAVRRYRELVVTLIVVLGISLVSAAMFSFLYLKALDKNRKMNTALILADNERKQLQEDKEHLQAQLFIPKKKLETTAPATKIEPSVEEPPNPPVKKVVKKEETMTADIKDLTLTKDEGDSETRIRFIVKNTCDLKTISGRVFVILKPDSTNPQDWLTMPPVSLKDGVPSTPSRGQFFSINHFKSVNFKFNNPLPDDHYKKMDVFIFSTDGDKVYENTYDVILDVIKKPVVVPLSSKPAAEEAKTVTVPPAAETANVTEKPVAVQDKKPLVTTGVLDTSVGSDPDLAGTHGDADNED